MTIVITVIIKRSQYITIILLTNSDTDHPLAILGGSRVVTNGIISRVIVIITHIRGLITPFKTTREPPSTIQSSLGRWPKVPMAGDGRSLGIWVLVKGSNLGPIGVPRVPF